MSIRAIANHVYQTLGHGHSESVYHRAMEVGLRKKCIQYETEKVVTIKYEGHVVGSRRFDLVIEGDTIVELKSVSALRDKEQTQLKNYMDITGISKGILINFPTGGDELEYIEKNSSDIIYDINVSTNTNGLPTSC